MMSRRRSEALPERHVSRAAVLARRGRVLALAGVFAVAPMVTGFPLTSGAQAHPVKSQVHKVGFLKSSVTAMRTGRLATRSVAHTAGAVDPLTTAQAVAVTPVQDVAGAVTVVGVTWPKSATPVRDSYQIRTLTGATWSQWQTLGVLDGGPDSTEAADTATTGTDPYVVTGASRYEVRSLTTDPVVSAAATVQVVDPGTSSADNVAQAPGAAAAAAVRPTILARSVWGADETIRKGTPLHGEVKVGFVHHTADSDPLTANSYTADQVPAMIRGMYAYHLGLGWDDIGYNFLIDRFGRTWEGRYGGTDQPVVGAHTLSYNSVSTGVAAIGNFDMEVVPQTVTDAFKQLFAWKFTLANIPATGASPVLGLDGTTPLQRVSGHRDANVTACPGQYLYARLPEIRTAADAIIGTPAITFTPGDYTGDGKADMHGVRSNGDLYLYRGNGRGGFSGAGVRIGAGWGIFAKVFSVGDFTGDGKADIVGVQPAGNMYLYRGNGRGGFSGAGVRIGAGWGIFAKVFSVGDFTGDGKTDIVGVQPAGNMYLYRGNGRGGFSGAGVRNGAGWGIFAKVF
jgi:hypothetical protein